VGITANDLIS